MSLCDKILFVKISLYFSETDDYDLISDFNNESLDIRIVSNKTLEKFRLTIEDKDEIMSYCKKNKYYNKTVPRFSN